MKKNLFWVLGVFLFFFSMVVFAGVGYLAGLKKGSSFSPSKSLGAGEPKYKIASTCVDKDCPAEVEWDLGGNGKTVLVRAYSESSVFSSSGSGTCPLLPIILKIFSKENGLLNEESVYKFDANALSSLRIVKSFWGEGKDAVLAETMSTGCGSGYASNLNFFRVEVENGKLFYLLVSGPSFGELDSYKITKTGEILLAKGIWDPNESHFEPHRYHLEKYVFNSLEKKFEKSDLGTTRGKYSGSIEEIIAAEPAVLEK